MRTGVKKITIVLSERVNWSEIFPRKYKTRAWVIINGYMQACGESDQGTALKVYIPSVSAFKDKEPDSKTFFHEGAFAENEGNF